MKLSYETILRHIEIFFYRPSLDVMSAVLVRLRKENENDRQWAELLARTKNLRES